MVPFPAQLMRMALRVTLASAQWQVLLALRMMEAMPLRRPPASPRPAPVAAAKAAAPPARTRRAAG